MLFEALGQIRTHSSRTWLYSRSATRSRRTCRCCTCTGSTVVHEYSVANCLESTYLVAVEAVIIVPSVDLDTNV